MAIKWIQILPTIYFVASILYSDAQLTLDDLINNVFSTVRSSSTPPPLTPHSRLENIFNSSGTNSITDTPSTTPNRSGRSEDNLFNVEQNFNPARMYKNCGLDKECVPRHLCVDGAIVTTGENLIDIRIDDDVCAYNELCCDLSRKVFDVYWKIRS